MLALFASEECLSQRLARYFGDGNAPQRCGHCSVCAGQIARLPEAPALAEPSRKQLQGYTAAFVQRYAELRGTTPGAECLTRFLCGIGSPLFTRMRARSIEGFAALEDYPYATVRRWVEALC
ncbi:hypothetical protein D3C76_1192470 [compost metagenome]